MKTLRWFSRASRFYNAARWLGVGAFAAAGLTLYPATSAADDADASKIERRDRKATDDPQSVESTDALHRQQQQQNRDGERNRQNAQNAQQTEPNRRTANFHGDQAGRDSDATTSRDRGDSNQSDAQRNQNDRGDGRQANARQRDRDMTWQDGRQNQNQNQNQSQAQNQSQRQRFGVTWADDDDHWTVDEVARGSVAARAGLRTDDEVVSLGGKQISSSRDFMRSINGGQRVALVVVRDGRRQTLWLGGNAQGYPQQYNQNQIAQNQNQQNQSQRSFSQDAGQGSSDAHAYLGVQLNDNYPNLAVVKQVLQNSPAQQAGLQPGDTITSVNGQRVSSPQELTTEVQQLQPGDAVQIQFSRPQMRSVQVRLGGRSADAAQASYQSSDQDRTNRDRSRDQSRSDSSDNSQRDAHDHDKSSSSDSQDKSHSNDD